MPKTGGVLRFAANSETRGLDPIVSFGEGINGNTELAAIFDVLVRWDPATGKYEPQTAEAVTPNADSTQWTVKIRSGIKFTDGTDYDAAAVKAGLERHMSAANTTKTRTNMAIVDTITVGDPLTLVIKLKASWPGFPSMLGDRPGMIPSPTAVAACGSTAPAQCAFNQKPVGAGPFQLKTYRPGEVIELERNATYFKGRPYLDGIRITAGGDGGGVKTLDSLKVGTVDMAHLADPVAVGDATSAGLVRFVDNRQAGAFAALFFNDGLAVNCKGGEPKAVCVGRADGPAVPPSPTQNPTVRQAIAAAIDTSVINVRAWGGKGRPGTELVQKDFKYNPSVAGPAYNLARAKQLVADAKAAGFNGTVRYLCSRDQEPMSTAVVTMLQAAGFTVEADTSGDVASVAARYITNKDFDIVCAGLRVGEDDLQWTQSLYSSLGSDAASNRMGYKNPKMDAAILALRDARSDAEKTAAFKQIAEIYTADVPFLALGSKPEVIAARAQVKGLRSTLLGAVLLDTAWIDA